MRDIIPFLFLIPVLAFIAWSVIRARRWEKYQQEAANRGKLAAERMSKDEDRYEQVMEISREHLQVSKELLAEIKALRDDLKKK